MTDMREAERERIGRLANEICGCSTLVQHRRDIALIEAEIDRRVAEERANLESKFRCVVSHATGGSFQDIDASLNEISVRISQFRTQLWERAKQSGAKEERAKLLERLREPSEGMLESFGIHKARMKQNWQAMLAQFEKENSDG